MSSFVNLLDIVYPVGSVYYSTETASPASTIGGTWTAVSSDTFICAGTPLSTGGENTKTLTMDELPGTVWGAGGRTYTEKYNTYFTPGNMYGISCTPNQAAKTYDSRPKYLAFNIWYRIA